LHTLFALSLLFTPVHAEGPGTAEVQQTVLPGLHARQEGAEARTRAAEAWLRGEASLTDAFGELEGAPLHSRTWIRGRLLALDDQARSRALDALEPADEAVRGARSAAHAAESEAAALERRVLLSVDAVVERYPVLAALEPLEAVLDAQVVHDPPASYEPGPASHAYKAGELSAAVRRLRSAALDAANRPLDDAIEADLALVADLATHRALLQPIGPAEDAVERLGAINAALVAPPPSGSGDVHRIASALDALDRARLQVEATTLAQGLQSTANAASEAELSQAKERAAASREQADRAQAEATDAQARLYAQALDLVADEETAAAGRLATLEQQDAADAEARAALQGRLGVLRAEAQEALKRGRLDPERGPGIDGSYRQLRSLMGDLRHTASSATEASGRLVEQREVLATHRDSRLTALATLSDDAEAWQAMEGALAAQDTALTEAVTAQQAHRAAVLHLLLEARDLRRDLKSEISAELSAEDRSRLFEDLSEELRLFGPELDALVQSRLADLRSLPRKLLDLGWLQGVVVGSLGLLALLLAWGWVRPRTPAAVEVLLRRLGERLPPWRRRSLSRIPAAAVPVATAAVDLTVGLLLVGPASQAFPELGLLLLVYLQVALVRLLFGLFELAVVKRTEPRPALLRFSDETWSQARRTVRVLVLWGVVRQFLAFATLNLLEADALHGLVTGLADLILVGLVGWLLHLWEPAVRAELSRRASSGVLAGLTQAPKRGFTRIPRAAAGGLVLLAGSAWRLLDLSASSRSVTGRFVNWIARRRLAPTTTTEPVQPPAGLLEALLEDDPESAHLVIDGANDIDARFAAVFSRWRDDHRPGLVLLAGDRGAGKGTWVARHLEVLARDDLPVLRAAPSTRLGSELEALRWLAQLLEIDPPATLDEAVDRIEDLPRRIIVLDHLERSFLRRVGGFEGLRTLFAVAQLCAEEHFWVLSMHLPAWRYLSRLHAVLDTRIFSEVLELPPFEESDLRRLLEGRTRRAGYAVCYGSMERGGVLTEADAEAEAERAARTFFRLLAESSGGNPAIALRMWNECLAPGPDARTLEVRLSERLVRELPAGLSDNDLFVLAALRMQDIMDVHELAQVTNLPTPAARAVVRSLLDRGLLRERDEQVAIPYRKLPAVHRVLTRRHFLHWRA